MAEALPLTALRLRARMEELQCKQDDLAIGVGATQGAISQILTGKSRNSRLLPKIADNLGVNLGWLLGVTDDKIDMFDAEGHEITEDDLAAIRAGTSDKRLMKPEQLRLPGVAQVAPAPARQAITMQVLLPSEDALARMFEGLLRPLDRSMPVAEFARILARRLPTGLAQLQDLSLEHAPAEAPVPDEAAPHPATDHPEPPRASRT